MRIQSTKAFTLAEAVCALMVFSLTIVLIFSSIHSLNEYHAYHENERDSKRYKFQATIENYLSRELMIDSTPDRIVTQSGDRKIYYEHYQQMIRRTSDRGGHEPLLLQVAHWTVEKHETFYILHIRLIDGKEYHYAVNIVRQPKE